MGLVENGTLDGPQERIRRFAEANPRCPWIVGRGWVYGSFPGGFPTRGQLEGIVPDRPACMDCRDGMIAFDGVIRDVDGVVAAHDGDAATVCR